MKATLSFSGSIYNCEVIIKDSFGSKNYIIELDGEQPVFLEIDIEGSSFEMTLIPEMADYRSALSNMEVHNWKDKLAKKIGGTLCSIMDRAVLRVGCTYRVCGIEENDVICLSGQEYIFESFDKLDLFDIVPMMYSFFEAYHNGLLCECTDTFAQNRKDVVSAAKKLVLLDFGLHLIITYPLQIGRVKRLTSDKKVKSTIIKFNRMDKEERQKALDKKERIMSK